MKIDYISDLHEDFYIPKLYKTNKEFISKVWANNIDGDILIISGDLSESSSRVKKNLEDIYLYRNYDKIFYVPGNHDLFSEDNLLTLEAKYAYLKTIIDHDDIHCLDGEIIKYNGIKISGSSMWYDYSYLKNNFNHITEKQMKDRFLQLWRRAMIDSRRTISCPIKFFEKKKIILENVYKEVDIFISHINPMNTDRFMDQKYKGQITNTFFCFNGSKYVIDGSIKYFFFGHTHSKFIDEELGLYCNPYGYPGENKHPSIKSVIYSV
jgi:DNA repair exonuclease SbcCD nuclease subunit